MPNPGSISGFLSVGILNAIQRIFCSANTAVRCRKELASLKDLIMKIEPIIKEIQQNRVEFNRNLKDMKPSAVNTWLEQLDVLLQQASKMVLQCTIPTWDVCSRYQTRKMITRLISDINELVKLSPLIRMAQTQELLADALGQMRETLEAPMDSVISTSSAASTSGQSIHSPRSARTKLIDEPLIVGQDRANANLHKLVIDDAEAKIIGVLGKGGSGKTLLLKTLFNSQEVRNHFTHGFLLWITVTQVPSVTTLRNELCTQITLQKHVNLPQNMNEEYVKIWLSETLQQSSRFALFLDDVWDMNVAELLEDLGILLPVTAHRYSKVIVSSRNRDALLKLGVGDKCTLTMEDLIQDDSWKLFSCHAFSYNNRKLPVSISEEEAKLLCNKCGGLPLSIKVVARTMAGRTDPKQWEWAAQCLPRDDSVYDCLRLSYDALGKDNVHLQLCFLYAAATFLEDKIISVYEMIQRWVGEALLPKKMLPADRLQLGYDPFEMGKLYLNILADRCLIEPLMRGVDGQVEYFRVHDAVHDLGIRIAQEEENFLCRINCNLTTLNENDCSGRTRIFLSDNQLTSLPDSWRAPQICSLFLPGNMSLTKVPKTVMRSMISLKFLDLSGTSVQSLPKSVGDLKQLVCLALIAMPALKTLPRSVTNLVRLEILDVSFSAITALPSGLHKLTSLRYLDITCCKDLQYLPASISRLTSLQYLLMFGCTCLWKSTGAGEHKKYKRVASINDLATLHQLKMLSLTNNGDIISPGTLRCMTQMDTMQIALTQMEFLPPDISIMSKLRRLVLECPHLTKLESNFCNFQNMSNLELTDCNMLEELPRLEQLKNLKQLRIIRCSKLKKFPQEFGKMGAFVSLEIFSLLGLDKLEELPKVEEGAMASLRIFTLMECPALRILPHSYLELKTLHKLRIYGCARIAEEDLTGAERENKLADLTAVERENKLAKVTIMSLKETEDIKQRYFQVKAQMTGWLYGEFWCNELFLFLKSIEAF